jgi:hypothetical protein
VGYGYQQSTRPQTLAYALADSPTGQLAWIVEKFHTRTDNHGRPDDPIDRDELLTNVSPYWLTNTAGSSARSMPPGAYRLRAARWATAVGGERVTKSIRNREATSPSAPSMTAMCIKPHGTLPNDPDASLALDRHTLRFEVRNDLEHGGMHPITVGQAEQPGRRQHRAAPSLSSVSPRPG